MPKKTSGRKFQKYLRGQVDELTQPDSLAARTLAATNFDETVNERTYASSMVAIWSLDNFTGGVAVGPPMVGVAHSDYTAAEIEEFVENTGSWNEGDLVSQEVAKRKVRIVGTFELEGSSGNEVITLNEGKPIKTKLGWTLLQGQTLKLWTYNLGTAAFLTTIPNIHCEGHINLWPR